MVIGGILFVSLIAFLLTKFLRAGDRAAGAALVLEDDEATMINCVVSFGSAAGGQQFAKDLKSSIAARTGWDDSSIYLDRDALEDKDGTSEKSVSTGEGEHIAYLNPSWATYYQVRSPLNT